MKINWNKYLKSLKAVDFIYNNYENMITFNKQNNFEFLQYGKAQSSLVRFDQYYLSNDRAGKMLKTVYNLNYTFPFVNRVKFVYFSLRKIASNNFQMRYV